MRSDLRIRLWDDSGVNLALVFSLVMRDVLVSQPMRWAANPSRFVSATVSEDRLVAANVVAVAQWSLLLSFVTASNHRVCQEFILLTLSSNHLTVDGTLGLAEETILGRDKAGVAGKVLLVPWASLGMRSRNADVACSDCFDLHLNF